MKRLILAFSIAALAATHAAPVSAQECTRGYVDCLNDTWDLTGFLQVMADIECFVKYLNCVRVS